MNTANPAPAQPAYTSAQIDAMICEADAAFDALNSARREVASEYSERMRKLRDFKISAHQARRSPEDLARLNATGINPQILRLLSQPTWGL